MARFFRYENYPGVTLSSDFYNASKKPAKSKKKLLTETTRRTAQPKWVFPKSREKTIFQPELCTGFLWPSCQCIFKEHLDALALDKSEIRINQYLHRTAYVKAKHIYPLVSNSISEAEFFNLISLGFDLKDQEKVIYHYIPYLKRSL